MQRKNTNQRKIFFPTFRQIALIFSCLTIFSLQKATAQYYKGDWKIVNPQNSPAARFGLSMTQLRIYNENGVIIFDGQDSAQKMYNDLHSYNNGNWKPETPVNNAPPARAHHCAWYLNGKMYAHAGLSENQVPLNDLWNYDPTTREWTQIPQTNPGPSARYYHKANITSDSKVIISGGYNGSRKLNDLWLFDPVTSQWVEINTNIPVSTESHVSEIVNDELYIFTGGQGFKYNIITNIWTSGLQAPPIMSGSTSAVVENKFGQKIIFLFGGVDMSNNFSDKVYEYNTSTGILTQQSQPMPMPANKMAGAIINSENNSGNVKIVFFGGITGSWSNISVMGQTWEYNISETTVSVMDNVIDNNNELKIFPNPADEYIKIHLANSSKEFTFEIYNVLGERIISEQLLSEQRINIRELPSGIYILRMIVEKFQYVKKFIINKPKNTLR